MFNSNYGMYSGYEVEKEKETKTEYKNVTSTDMYSSSACSSESIPGVMCPPIYECPQERQIHRQIIHEVPHVCPINTRIINHHIYRHTYSPCYTCCEENEICNVNEGCCDNF